jgi:hypothetical protein
VNQHRSAGLRQSERAGAADATGYAADEIGFAYQLVH